MFAPIASQDEIPPPPPAASLLPRAPDSLLRVLALPSSPSAFEATGCFPHGRHRGGERTPSINNAAALRSWLVFETPISRRVKPRPPLENDFSRRNDVADKTGGHHCRNRRSNLVDQSKLISNDEHHLPGIPRKKPHPSPLFPTLNSAIS